MHDDGGIEFHSDRKAFRSSIHFIPGYILNKSRIEQLISSKDELEKLSLDSLATRDSILPLTFTHLR